MGHLKYIMYINMTIYRKLTFFALGIRLFYRNTTSEICNIIFYFFIYKKNTIPQSDLYLLISIDLKYNKLTQTLKLH